MRTNRAVKAQKDNNIVTLYLKGYTYPQICKQLHASPHTIQKALSDADAKAMIQQAHRDMIKMLPQAVNVYQDAMKATIKDDRGKVKVDHATRIKAANKVADVTGIAPSHSQSVFINQLFLQQNSFGDIQFQGLAKRFLAMQDDDDNITVNS